MAAELAASRVAAAAFFILCTGTFLRFLYILPLTNPRRKTQSKPTRQTPAHLLIVLGSGGHTAEMISMLRTLDIQKYAPRTYVISSGDDLSSTKAIELETRLRELQEQRRQQEQQRQQQKQQQRKNRQDRDRCERSGARELDPWEEAAAAKQRCENDHTLRNANARAAAAETYSIISVPRARNIHQPLYTTPLSCMRCLLASIALLIIPDPQQHSFSSPDLIITNGPATGVIVILASLIVRFCGLQRALPGVRGGGGGDMRSVYVESWARVKTLSLSGKILFHLGLTDRFLVQWESLAGKGREYRGPLVE